MRQTRSLAGRGAQKRDTDTSAIVSLANNASNDPPCWGGEAVERARKALTYGGEYILGTGDYAPKPDGTDLPWTIKAGRKGSDCAGFAICWAWKLRRHRPGFNMGPWATVSDDINCNSALEDGLHKQDLFYTLNEGACVQPGDLLLYPTIRVTVNGTTKKFIGHVGLVERVPVGFNYGAWGVLDIIQCHGPNGRSPGVVRTDGGTWVRHDALWGKPEHRTRVVRPKERP